MTATRTFTVLATDKGVHIVVRTFTDLDLARRYARALVLDGIYADARVTEAKKA